MTMRFDKYLSATNVRHSGSGRYKKSLSRGFAVWGDQAMRGKSNTEVSDARSERLDSDLVLGKSILHSLLQRSYLLLTKITLLVGKEKFPTNLYSLLALRIKISGSKNSWKDYASGFILVWVLQETNLS